MNINSSKKTLLSLINGNVLGASTGQMVSFKFAGTIAKAITAASTSSNGSLIFAIDEATGAGAIWQDSHLVSSKVIDYSIADSASKDHSQKTVTLKYIGSEGVETKNFDLIDEAGLKAYFTDSQTIALNATTKKYEVRLVDKGGLKVNENGGIEVELGDVVNVDGKTIVSKDVTDPDTQEVTKGVLSTALAIKYVKGTPETSEGAGDATKSRIALFDKNAGAGATELSAVEVEDIIGSGIIKSAVYNEATGHLIITWDSDPVTTTDIDLSKMLDVLNDVVIETASQNYMSATADTSIMKLGLTSKSINAIDAAETAIQTITSANNYLTVGEKTGEANQKTVALTVETADFAIAKYGDSDSTISGTTNKLAKSDDTAAKVQTFVNTRISEEVAKLDSFAATADLSTTVGSEVYVKIAGEIVDGKFKNEGGLTVSTQIGQTTGVRYVKADPEADPAVPGVNPTLTVDTFGLITDKDATNLKNYIDDKIQKLSDEQGAVLNGLDANLDDNDTPNFIHVGIDQENGLIKNLVIDSSYGSYGTVTRDSQNVASAGNATDGISKVSDTQTWVMGIINGLDLNNESSDASAADTKGYIKSIISETDGIVKNESLTTTYGNYDTHTSGIATVEDTSVFVQNLLTWTVLP